MNDNSQKSLTTSLSQLVQSTYLLAPSIVLMGIIIATLIISVTLIYTPLMIATLIILVVFTAILVFIKRESFGDATLSLVGGLLTILKTEWTINLYIVFCIAWIGFACLVFLISSIKIAARQEDILKRSASILSNFNIDEIDSIEKELNDWVKSSKNKMLSNIQRAEVIQLLAYRKVPKPMLLHLLNSVEILFVITKVDTGLITNSLVDIYKAKEIKSEQELTTLLDRLYMIINDISVPPQLFFEAFIISRRLLLQKILSPEEFLNKLCEYLEMGIDPKDIYNDVINLSNIK